MDGEIIPAHPYDPVATPVSATVPLLLGWNTHEQAFFQLRDPSVFDMDEAGLRQRVTAMAGEEKALQAIELYKKLNPGKSPCEIFFLLGTDRDARMSATTIAERRFQQGKAPTYMYLFAWRTPALDGKLGSLHTAEIPFVFDNTGVPEVMTVGSPEEKALAAKTSEAWIRFAKTADPNHEGLPDWPAYTPKDRAMMVFDNTCRMVPDQGSEERKFWSL